MQYDDKMFSRIAIPRIKKFFELNKETFIAQSMDLKDLLQEMRVALWQRMEKYSSLEEEDCAKVVNKILSTRLIDAKKKGYRHMKTEDITIEENDEEVVVKGHIPQFLDIDSVNEAHLQDCKMFNSNNAKTIVDTVRTQLSSSEQSLLNSVLGGHTEDELACKQICCKIRHTCDISVNPSNHLSTHGNIGKNEYKSNCIEYSKLNKQSVHINRLKKELMQKIKKLVKKL